jgi:hypothetical protein
LLLEVISTHKYFLYCILDKQFPLFSIGKFMKESRNLGPIVLQTSRYNSGLSHPGNASILLMLLS